MFFDIDTGKKQRKICFKLTARKPCNVVVLAYDKTKPNTYYCKRIVALKQAGEEAPIEVNLPISPEVLTLDIHGEGDVNMGYMFSGHESFDITDFEDKSLSVPGCWVSDKTRAFINLAKEFCNDAGVLAPGRYWDEKYEDLVILYLPELLGKDGMPVTTPARTNKKTKEIELNRPWIMESTVPMRFLFCTHEYGHSFMNDDPADELEADKNGLRLYLAEGFPKIEAIYAFTKVFVDNAQNRERTKELMKMIKEEGSLKSRK